MSNIKFFALGGLGENGKNMYIVEVNERIFVLDAGLKYPDIDMYGVDAVVPDMQYLVDNKDRIDGILLSHGHEDHIGALPFLLKQVEIPKIYEYTGIGYLGGKTLNDLMNAEADSTRVALADYNRPTVTISIPKTRFLHCK